MKIVHTFNTAFTIVELATVISVIGILAGLTILGYGSWQDSIATKTVHSDLQMAANAMKSANNFSSTGYPAALPSTLKQSTEVTLDGGGFNSGSSFCIQGSSTRRPGIASWYVTETESTPKLGDCRGIIALAGHWKMNGNAGDVSGNGNNGTIYAATATTGQNGDANDAYNFNGTSAYIDAGTSTSLTFTDNFTLSAWIRPTGYHTTGYYGLKNGIIGRGPATTFNYVMQATDSTTISFIKRTGAEGLVFYNFTGVPSLTNVWTLATVTVKSGVATLYINGAAFNSIPVGPIAGAANDRLYLGTVVGGNVECLFIGSIDDVRIYGRALPAADVTALYAAGAQ